MAVSARLPASLTPPWRHGLTNGTLQGRLSCLSQSQDLVWSLITYPGSSFLLEHPEIKLQR